MKNRQGFTLIELLGVILLVSLLSVIAYNVTVAIFEEKEDEIEDTKLQLIYVAARNYAKENLRGDSCVFVDELVSENLVAVELEEFELIKDKGIVELTESEGIYSTRLVSNCTDNNGIEYKTISDCDKELVNDNFNVLNDRTFYFKDDILFKEHNYIRIENLNNDNQTSYLNQVNNYELLYNLLNSRDGNSVRFSKGELLTKLYITVDYLDSNYEGDLTTLNTSDFIIVNNASTFEMKESNMPYSAIETACNS